MASPSPLTRPLPSWLIPALALVSLVAALAVSRAGIGYGSLIGWVSELVLSWAPLSLFAVLIPIDISRRMRGALGLGLLLVVFIAAASPLKRSANPAELTVATANLKMGSADIELISAWARGADVLVLQEVTHEAAAALEALEGWRFRLVLPEDSPFGIALLSNRPFSEVENAPDNDGQPATVRVVLDLPTNNVPFVAAHPFPPISADAHVQRDALIKREALWLTHRGGGVMAGDFNATPWGSGLHLAEAHGLRSAALWGPTWPTPAAHAALGIAIDHVMASADKWCVIRTERGPSTGSDHLPVMAELTRC